MEKVILSKKLWTWIIIAITCIASICFFLGVILGQYFFPLIKCICEVTP